MWDNPQALRQLANTLLGIGLLLMFFGTVHYTVHLPMFALNAVQLTVAPQRVDKARIAQIVSKEIRGNFFTVDLEGVRNSFEKLPWVRKVSVRRHFPWRLEVNLEEQVALARWNGNELVNTYGEIFSGECDRGMPEAMGIHRPVSCGDSEQGLPKFIGQTDTSVEVTRMYKVFSEQLVPLKQEVVQISLSPRHAWQVRLNSGMVLELGREQAQERLARFVAVYPHTLASVRHTVNYVDLRYNNGFAAYLPGGTGAVKG